MGVLWGAMLPAAELTLDFSGTPTGQMPDGFRAALAGGGQAPEWKVVMAEVPSLMPSLSEKAPRTAARAVLTQTVLDPTDERFPLLIYEKEEFGDFALTTRFRLLGGQVEQMAGVAFRLQDEHNFYVVRASALGRNIRFYKVVGGLRGDIIGPSVNIETNRWYELGVECRGNQIQVRLDGEPVMPPLQDTTFSRGRIAFWTKSDSECQFAGVHLSYTPTVPLGERMVQAALKDYSRVLDLQLFARDLQGGKPRIVAAKNASDVGQPGGEGELGALEAGNMYVGKGKGTVVVVMPVRDRNGDPVGAARIRMDSFPGQTENNALVRAKPIVKRMESVLQSSQDSFP